MKTALYMIITAAVLLAAAYYIYQDPRVRDLFEPVARERPGSGKTPEQPARPAVPAPPKDESPEKADPVEPEPETEVPRNQVPNEEVGRVLLQILAAQGLASGIQISVSDRFVELSGEVDSEANRRRILETVEKGREYRQIKADRLTVSEKWGDLWFGSMRPLFKLLPWSSTATAPSRRSRI